MCLYLSIDYSKAIKDISGLQNTLNLSSHEHLRTIGGTNTLAYTAAVKAMYYTDGNGHSIDAPVGTSGWFLGSMGQWNIFLRNFCHVNGDDIQEIEPDYSGNEDYKDDEELVAAYCENAGTVKSWGKPFVDAGYSNPFANLNLEYDEGYGVSVGFVTSTEIDYKRSWVISFDFTEIDDEEEDEEDWTNPNASIDVSFIRYIKGQGLNIIPFLAF